MKKLFLFLLFYSLSFLLTAQKAVTYEVIGQIIEKNSGNGVPYATVIIKNDSIKETKAMACDASGKFTLSMGSPVNYILTVSSVGYKEFSMPLNISEIKTDVGKLVIEEGVQLQEVTITAQRPLVKVDVDKIVYSIESDPESQTNNVLEMLRKVPLVTVDAEENITVNGQSNFKVLVNGKSSSMMSSNLKEVLKSMPANSVKDLEVITNPSSKYDAEGVGGIINIITNKKTLNGFNGSVSSGIDARGSFNLSMYLAAKIKKFSFSTRYYGGQFMQPESGSSSSAEYFNNTDYYYSNSNGVNSYKGMSNGFSGEASYEIDSLNLISLSFWGYEGSYTNKTFNETEYRNMSDEVTRRYANRVNNRMGFGALSGNIDYQKTYKKPDKSLTFSYKLDNNPQITRSASDIDGILNYPSFRQRSENRAVGREQTFQADYFDPITKTHQLEGGIKFILRQNTSNSEIFRNDTVKLENVNDLDYDQYIMGAYFGYLFKYKKLSTKAGLRLERTWNDGTSKASGVNTDFTNRLLNLVPYITLSLMPKEGRTFKLSYTQRLSRPGIWYLNPYVNNIDSMNISYGNPRLDAEIAHVFETGYTYFTPKLNFTATASSSFTNNSIERISKVELSGATVSTYENIGNNQRHGLNIYFSYRPTGKLNIYLNGGSYYVKMEGNSGYTIKNEGLDYNGSLGGRWTLWKDGSVNTNFGIFSPYIMLQGRSSAFYYTSLGVSQYLLKRKLMISLSTTDPFWPRKKYSSEMEDRTFHSYNESSYITQNLRFSLTYNFGKMQLQVKKASRGIKNDDLKSGGSNQEGGAPR